MRSRKGTYKRIAFCNDPEGTSWTRYVTQLSEVADGLGHQEVRIKVLLGRDPSDSDPEGDRPRSDG
jgi:biotin synthase-related radical SAM superfamily protein